MTVRSKRIQIFLMALGLAALWLGGLFWFVRGTEAMQPPQTAGKADAIVVLTGGTNRLQTGFDLLNKDLGKKLFISGVYRGVEAKELMSLSRQESEKKLDCCIDLGSAENTMQNASETIAWLKKEGFTSFYLVTANYHMRRALLEFNALSSDLAIIPWPVAPEKLDMKNWWRDGAFRALIIREYMKYLLTRGRHFLAL